MTPYLIGLAFGVACFVVGFFVGKKHGARVDAVENQIKDTLGKR